MSDFHMQQFHLVAQTMDLLRVYRHHPWKIHSTMEFLPVFLIAYPLCLEVSQSATNMALNSPTIHLASKKLKFMAYLLFIPVRFQSTMMDENQLCSIFIENSSIVNVISPILCRNYPQNLFIGFDVYMSLSIVIVL